jgi:hypothetical protein
MERQNILSKSGVMHSLNMTVRRTSATSLVNCILNYVAYPFGRPEDTALKGSRKDVIPEFLRQSSNDVEYGVDVEGNVSFNSILSSS